MTPTPIKKANSSKAWVDVGIFNRLEANFVFIVGCVGLLLSSMRI